jgi:hypothetical protein
MIDINQLPTITIDLDQCLHASQIKNIMKRLGIKYYCYAFIYKSTIMKYGQSADADWMRGSYGERVYRQSFHIPGWPTKPSPKSAGNDMAEIIKNFPGIGKNDVCVKVWDMTNYKFAVEDDPRFEVTQLEDYLLDTHKKQFGSLPIGNLRDESHIRRKTRVTDLIFNSMFDTIKETQ